MVAVQFQKRCSNTFLFPLAETTKVTIYKANFLQKTISG